MKKFLVSIIIVLPLFVSLLSSNICLAALINHTMNTLPIKFQVNLGPRQDIQPGAVLNYTININCLLI